MKTICAWCGKLISATCPHCDAPLTPAAVAHHTHTGSLGGMVCTNGGTPIYYSRLALELMESSHGICAECFAAQKKRGPTGVAETATPPAIPNPSIRTAPATPVDAEGVPHHHDEGGES